LSFPRKRESIPIIVARAAKQPHLSTPLAIISKLRIIPIMNKRDLRPFKKFCLKHGRQELWISVESYLFRDLAALYHISNIRDRLEKIKQPSNIQEAPKIELELRFEVDALMLALNSMIAIVAQIINEAVLAQKLPAIEVNLETVKKGPNLPPAFKAHIDKICGNAFYREIREYCNTTKHIRAIGGQVSVYLYEPVQSTYETGEVGNKQPFKLDVSDLENCRRFVKEHIEKLIELVQTTLCPTN
jgi:hypothetical protein